MIMDTGAAGSVVSMSYLSKVDPSWESKISGEGSGLWRGYGSDLTPKGIYTTGVVFCHPRGDIRCKMSFTVMADCNLPSYFIIGIDNIRLYGIKLNVCNEFFTIGRNLKRHFQVQCKKTLRGVNTLSPHEVDVSSTIANPDVSIGKPTPEPQEFEEALHQSTWDPALSQGDKDDVLKLIHQFPVVFGHCSRQLGGINSEEFDITLTVEGKHPPCLQKKAYPASPQRRKEIEANISELLALGVIVPVDSTPRNAIVSPVLIQYQNGKARLCGDCRSLNDYTVSDIYAIPRIDTVLHGLKGAKKTSLGWCQRIPPDEKLC